MHKIISVFAGLAIFNVFLNTSLFCDKINSEKGSATDLAIQEDTTGFINATNEFAIDLYSIYKSTEGNIFFSPYSISDTFAMTYEGAREKTAEEIQKAFHFPQDINITRQFYLKIYNSLNGENKEYELRTANALWAEKSFEFLKDYFNVIKNYYNGEATNVDFINESEESRKTINYWTEEQTNKKIINLISKNDVDSTTRLIVTNAVYFKGKWADRFDRKNTKMLAFKSGTTNQIKVPTMSLIGSKTFFNYMEIGMLQILELPYAGEKLSMLILLPKGDSLNYLEASLNIKLLDMWRNTLEKRRVDVYLPKFMFETRYFLNDTLKKMGMPTAFSLDADFSGMTGDKDLFISDAIHQAFIEVNEEGTEAAAATAATMGVKAAEGVKIEKPRVVFNANHPFIFIIQEKETGTILFLGRVVNPAQ